MKHRFSFILHFHDKWQPKVFLCHELCVMSTSRYRVGLFVLLLGISIRIQPLRIIYRFVQKCTYAFPMSIDYFENPTSTFAFGDILVSEVNVVKL